MSITSSLSTNGIKSNNVRTWGKLLAAIHSCNTGFFTAYLFVSLLLLLGVSWYIALMPIFVIFFWAGSYANYDIFAKNVPEVLENLISENGLFDTNKCDDFKVIDKDVEGNLETKQVMFYETRYILMCNTLTNNVLIYDRDNPTKVIKIPENQYNLYKQQHQEHDYLLGDDTQTGPHEHLIQIAKRNIISNKRKFFIATSAIVVGISVGLMGSLPIYSALLKIILLLCAKLAIPTLIAIVFATPIVMFVAIVSLVCLSFLFINTVVNYLKDDKNLLALKDDCNDLFNLIKPNCKLIVRDIQAEDKKITDYQHNIPALSFTGKKAYVLFHKRGQSPELYFVNKDQQTFTKCKNIAINELKQKLSLENQTKLAGIIKDNNNEQISLTFKEFRELHTENIAQDGEFRTKCKRIFNVLFCLIGSAISLIGVFMTMIVFVIAAKNLLINFIPKFGLIIIDFVGFVLAAIPRMFFAITSFLKTYKDSFNKKPTPATPENQSSKWLNLAIFLNALGNGMLSLQGGLHSEALHGIVALCLHHDIGSKIVIQCSAILSGISGALNSACTVLSRGSRSAHRQCIKSLLDNSQDSDIDKSNTAADQINKYEDYSFEYIPIQN